MKKLILLLVCASFFMNCNEDDTNEVDDFINITFEPNKLLFKAEPGGFTLSEFPFVMDGDTLGLAKLANIGSEKSVSEKAAYLLIDESPVGAFAVDQNTGYVIVKNAFLLDTRKIDLISFSVQARKNDLNRVVEKKYILTKLADYIVIGFDGVDPYTDYGFDNGGSNANYFKSYDLRGVNVKNGTALDTLISKPLIGQTQYSIQESIPAGALEIDSGSGIILVLDEKLFNGQLYPEISFKVEYKVEHKESNKIWTERIDSRVFLSNLNQELCGTSSSNLLYDPVYNEDGLLATPKLLPNIDGQDLVISTSTIYKADEFSFIPKKDIQLCSVTSLVALEGAGKTNFYELLNDKGDLLTGNSGSNEDGWGGTYYNSIWASLPYVLKANEKYTIRRKKDMSDGENSFITTPSGTTFNFPIQYEDVTITDAKFFKDDTQLEVTGIPLINLSFVK